MSATLPGRPNVDRGFSHSTVEPLGLIQRGGEKSWGYESV